ncbi:MAG: sensor histidine kinase, partial [Pseudomonadota bacterium]
TFQFSRPLAPSRLFDNIRPDARAAFLSITVFWLFYFALITLRSFVVGYDDPVELLWRRAVVVALGALVLWFVFLALRPLENRTIGLRMAAHFLLALPASASYAVINYTMFYVVQPLDFVRENEKKNAIDAVWFIVETSIGWYWFFCAWAACYLALRYAADVRTAERRAARWRAEAQSAQIRALRYQVNPHFLFNTLNSLSSLILKERPAEAEEMVLNLSTFLRATLDGDPEAPIPLEEEIEQQRLYLEIERVRFGDRLDFRIAIDPSAAQVMVPPMILQPIVENAVKYAVADARDPVCIRILATRQDDHIAIRVSDTGSDRDDAGDEERPLEFGTGLTNVRARLIACFGPDAVMTAGHDPAGGFVVTLCWYDANEGAPDHGVDDFETATDPAADPVPDPLAATP